jgi:hypothetical protein
VGQEPRNGATRGVARIACSALLDLSSLGSGGPRPRSSWSGAGQPCVAYPSAVRDPGGGVPQGRYRRLRRDVLKLQATSAMEIHGIDSAVSALRHKVDKALNPAKKGGTSEWLITAPALTSASDEDPDKLIAGPGSEHVGSFDRCDADRARSERYHKQRRNFSVRQEIGFQYIPELRADQSYVLSSLLSAKFRSRAAR